MTSSGSVNGTIYGINADFSGDSPPGIPTNILDDDGEIWIGSTALNAGGTHINVGNITSSSLSIGYSSPNITIETNGGGSPLETLSDDVSTVVTPAAGNIQLVGHVVEQGATKFSTVVAGTNLLNINPMSTARWIVDPLGFNGTHTTIASAITSATSGDTIFIMPGTYTENITLKAGVNLTAFECDAFTPNVTIVGKCTMTTAGTVSIYGIRLQTNSDFLLAVTGSAASIVKLIGCYLNCTNNTGISHTSSSGSSTIYLYNCQGDIGTTGITLIVSTSAGGLGIYYTQIGNSGNSTTPSSSTTGGFFLRHSELIFPFSMTSTGAVDALFCNLNSGATYTQTGTGIATFKHCKLGGGASSSISVGVGGTVKLHSSEIESDNTNAITGAGTLIYSDVCFTGTSSNINVTTQTITNVGPSSTFGSANSGNTNTLTLTNTSNTASSAANSQITVAGGTAADPQTTYTVSGVTSWSTGIDNSASDAYVLAASTALGTSNVMSAATGGAVSFVLGNVDVTKSASGADVSLTASNSSNTASSTATNYLTVAGTSAGDARVQYAVSGTTTWTEGLDNSASDAFVISASSALGTTNVMSVATTGEINYPLQPAFLAYLSSTASDVTGDTTQYTIIPDTEVFDQNADYNNSTGVFTAPVTGRYRFSASIFLLQVGAGHTLGVGFLSASNRGEYLFDISPAAIRSSSNIVCLNGGTLIDMDAADTASISIQVGGSTKTVDVFGDPSLATSFSGNLVA